MNVLGELAGSFDRDKMRSNRIKDILKDNPTDSEELKDDTVKMDKDDAKFIQLHLENSCPKYHMYFGDYNTEMFQKLCLSMWFKEFSQDDKIFEKEDECKYFYYIMKGTVHLLESSAEGEDKIARLHNQHEVFGLKKCGNEGSFPIRNRDAVAETNTSLIIIDAKEYENIRSKRVLSAAEAKIEFLTRYIPGFRSVDQKIIQEYETLFTKEKMTKGYRIIEQGKSDDHLYFIYSGECRILYNYNTNKRLKSKFDSLDESVPGFLLLGILTTGD